MKSQTDILALERLTVNQRDSKEWIEERQVWLTASNFGLICNRRAESSCPAVSNQLYENHRGCFERFIYTMYKNFLTLCIICHW